MAVSVDGSLFVFPDSPVDSLMTFRDGIEAAAKVAERVATANLEDGEATNESSVAQVIANKIRALPLPPAGTDTEMAEALLWAMPARLGRKQQIEHLAAALTAARADERAKVVAERDEALARVEELETLGEQVAAEFEGECWKAFRRLLNETNFDWEGDPVTADVAEQHLRDTIGDLERRAARADHIKETKP